VTRAASVAHAIACIGACVVVTMSSTTAEAAPFSYRPPGELVAGSGKGRVDSKVYAPGIRFPIQDGPAFANSQVWGHGGSSGPGGSQCDIENFSYPWHDNYCETRTWDMPLCPSGTGHQGQDVRTSDCKANIHTTVAVADGTITNVGSYSVYLTRADGTRFDYLHMSNVAVKVGQKVKTGDVMGKVSNVFGGTPTTVHLHFNIQQNVSGVGMVYVPPYLSLIAAYETLIGVADAGVSDAAVDARDVGVADASDARVDAPDVALPDTRPVSDGDSADLGDASEALQANEGGSSGCGCRTTGSSPSSSYALGLVTAALALAVTRRKRSR
jgi:MYXO-CTERM domain-containing protein